MQSGSANVVCVYLVLAFVVVKLANNCCSLQTKSLNHILHGALNKHMVVRCFSVSINIILKVRNTGEESYLNQYR